MATYGNLQASPSGARSRPGQAIGPVRLESRSQSNLEAMGHAQAPSRAIWRPIWALLADSGYIIT
jgi:hypothetical protein